MIVRSYNPIERGQPAIWLDEPVRSGAQVSRLMRQLREYPDGDGPVDVVIAGGGGNCGIGLQMYTLLREHPRPKRVTVFDAPSISGVIAMAGDHIRIVERGRIFLHDVGYAPSALANSGPQHLTGLTLRALARTCIADDALHCAIFARRTGRSPESIAALRAAETTLDAHRAVELGFADSIIPQETIDG